MVSNKLVNKRSLENIKQIFENRRKVCHGKTLEYSKEEREIVFNLIHQGISQRLICSELKLSTSTLHKWKNTYKDRMNVRCLNVIETQDEISLKSIRKKEVNCCKLYLSNSIFIKIPIELLTAELLREIKIGVK